MRDNLRDVWLSNCHRYPAPELHGEFDRQTPKVLFNKQHTAAEIRFDEFRAFVLSPFILRSARSAVLFGLRGASHERDVQTFEASWQPLK